MTELEKLHFRSTQLALKRCLVEQKFKREMDKLNAEYEMPKKPSTKKGGKGAKGGKK